ncbi:uncharacterized protein MONBRDRAFT_10332 [Monosiga brevicollis MX1]|uniref:SAP domain-containing protein n=1 Tax=Monosiga brevicollis TaxID=81824 RepID=A9V5X1_MONBE|nr:uncharacterized protein MONBRDRAFT_10332 [Monosiga brevicollis MX1]EDQ87122.1 predicted protein [Monosiga brevicollis MX1]|eukprot:XP_001748065.1 hypothetical protein [Monosiga brevicollis MX1]
MARSRRQSRGRLAAASRVAIRREKNVQRRRADAAVAAYQLAGLVHKKQQPLSALKELLDTSSPPFDTSAFCMKLFPENPSHKGRRPPPSLFCTAFGATPAEFHAARTRAATQPSGEINGRVLCTQEERALVAEYLQSLNTMTQTHARNEALILIDKLLSLRGQLGMGETQSLPTSTPCPLNHRERLFRQRLADAQAGRLPFEAVLSERWFNELEAEFRLRADDDEAQAEQHIPVVTKSQCAAHFRDLDAALNYLGFLHKTGPEAGTIIHEKMRYVWSMDELPNLRIGPNNVHAPVGSTQGPDGHAVPEQTASSTLNALFAISMAGTLAPPMVLYPQSDLSDATAAAPVNVYEPLLDDIYQHFMHVANKTGKFSRSLLVAFCRLLRAFIGDSNPVLLLVDGHRIRVSAPLVAYLRSINIHLFFIPPHTSKYLLPNDQWRHQIRFAQIVIRVNLQRLLQTHSLTTDDEIFALCAGIHAQSAFPNLVKTAFRNAGITLESRSVKHMLNMPRSATASSSPSIIPLQPDHPITQANVSPAQQLTSSAVASRTKRALITHENKDLMRALDIAKIDLKSLRDACRRLGVRVWGSKDELIDRLRQAVGLRGWKEAPSATASVAVQVQTRSCHRMAVLLKVKRLALREFKGCIHRCPPEMMSPYRIAQVQVS